MLSQLIECNVYSFHYVSGTFVVDSVPLSFWSITNEETNVGLGLEFPKIFTIISWIAQCTKYLKKRKVWFSAMNQFIWSLAVERMYKGSIMCVASGCNSLYPKKHRSFREDEHSPSSYNQSAVTPFNNSILLWSMWKTRRGLNSLAF